MEKFITSIKKKYQERHLHREKQWPPCHSSTLITLLLVNKKVGEGYFGNEQRGKAALEQTRNSLHYSELFEIKSGKKPVRKVLVEGDAGIGKTTFCLSLSEDWANGKIFQQFELLLFLPLRLRVVSSAGSLLELLKLLHSNTKVCESVANYLEEEEGENVLIIVDGWDELDKSGQQEGSFLYRLLFEDLPFASVILTSRPTASASLHQLPCIDQRIEIHGFNKVKSREYIQSEFTDDQEKAKRLLKQLNVTPFAESICSIPLNCAILCHLWRTCEEALPTTMTGLYTKVILNIVLHNLQKKEPYKGIKNLADFDALPDDLVESWQLLCEFAYRAMEENQIVFSREKLVSFFPQGLALDQKILCFGLLQSAEPILETGCGVSFHFLHQVFQEYLAALHIVRQPLDKQLEIIELKPDKSNSDINEELLRWGLTNDGARLFMNMLSRSQRFSLVWRFFCGIYFSDYNVKAQQPNVEHLIEPLLTMNILTFVLDGWLHLCLLAFEARNEIVSQKVLQSLHEAFKEMKLLGKDVSFPGQKKLIEPATNLIVLGRPFLSAYDCAAIVYLVSTIQECTTLKLIFSYSGIGEDSIRALADALANKNGELQIQRLSLDGNRLTDKCLSDLFGRASVAFKSLQTLEVSDNRIRAVSLHSIAAPMEKLSFRRLLILDLSHNPLGISGMQALDKAASSDVFVHLHSLNLQGCLTDDAGVNAKLLFKFHCHQLSVINLSYNNLGIPGATALSKIISKTNDFYFISKLFSMMAMEAEGLPFVEVDGPSFTVIINETNIGDLGLIAFVENLDSHIRFDTLDLKGNGIHDTGISHLIQAIISRKINVIETLYEFDLGNNPFGTGGALAIGKMLSSCSYEFKMLNLSQCWLTRSETVPPSSGPDSNNVICVRDVGQQLCQMPQSSILIDLTLDGNSFTGEGIYILAGFMYLCPSLILLSCSNCRITSEDLLQLFDILCGQFLSPSQRPCSELIGWYLNHNIIDDRGIAALLEHLPSLFSQLGCDAFQTTFEFRFDDNPVSAVMATRVNDEMKRRKEVNCH